VVLGSLGDASDLLRDSSERRPFCERRAISLGRFGRPPAEAGDEIISTMKKRRL